MAMNVTSGEQLAACLMFIADTDISMTTRELTWPKSKQSMVPIYKHQYKMILIGMNQNSRTVDCICPFNSYVAA